MYQNPLFLPEEFEKERGPILSEFREREDDPESYLMERALEAFLAGNYHPIIGTQDSIQSATVETMHAFRRRFYGRNNCMISVVGGVPIKTVRNSLEALLTKLPEAFPVPALPPVYERGEFVLRKSGIQEAYYSLLYPALPQDHPDRFKQDIMNYMLGGNDSALLFERIREDLGMACYEIYSYIMRHDTFSVLGINCGISPEELPRLHAEVTSQIDLMCTDYMEESMLARTLAAVRTSIAARSETSSGLASMISVPILKGERGHPVEHALGEIEKVTLDDIREQARKTFSQPALKAILLPEGM